MATKVEPDFFVGNCRVHNLPMPCHFASFDFAIRTGNAVSIGTAELRQDGIVLVDVVAPPAGRSRPIHVRGDTRYSLLPKHFPAAEELEIMRLPALGTLEFKGRTLKTGDSLRIADLVVGALVFDLRGVATTGDLARHSEGHEETAS